MPLVETWSGVRECIIGIAPMFQDKQGDFPDCIGTGFLISPLGIVATCRHVADQFDQMLRPPGFADIPAVAVVFLRDEAGRWGYGILQILSVGHGTVGGDITAYAGPQPPDISFLLLNTTETPHLTVATSSVVEGEDVAIGGLPMGKALLRAPGWLHQITPTLLRGTVAAVLPHHLHPTPHGILVQAQTLPGSSGSPVFRPKDGSVVGMVYAGVQQPGVIRDGDGNPRNAFTAHPASLAQCVSRDVIAGTLRLAEEETRTRDQVQPRRTWADRIAKGHRQDRRLGDEVFDVWPPNPERDGE